LPVSAIEPILAARFPSGIRSEMVIDISVSVAGRVSALVLDSEPDFQHIDPDGFGSPKRRADRFNRFRILALDGSDWTELRLPETRDNYHAHAALPGERWLLVVGRAADESDRNAHLLDAAGRTVARFHVGDAVEQVQTDERGTVWCSYFDEGCFGDLSLSRAGLAAFDAQGRVLLRFDEAAAARPGTPRIADCYAMNVASASSVWACYYDDFPLVELNTSGITRVYPRNRVRGARAFAVAEDAAVFYGGYQTPSRLRMFDLQRESSRRLICPVITDSPPVPIVFGRGPNLYFHLHPAVWRLDISGMSKGGRSSRAR
jgi:hypothetical protein